MTDRFEKNRRANKLRKGGQIEEATGLYRELSQEGFDPFVTAGLLHCLRKRGLFGEALPICDDVLQQYDLNDWCRNEVIWTLIQGRLETLDDTAAVEEVITLAETVLEIGPGDAIAQWRIVRPVLKSARSHNRWDIVSLWVIRVNPDELSAEPRKDNQDREGWSDQAVWHNYHIRSLIETGDKERAIVLALEAAGRFPRHSKFFRRLQALATHQLGRLAEAESIYRQLCTTRRPEWWMLHEYAQVVRELGNPKEALTLMCRAAMSQKKLEMLVSLLADIGLMCHELQMPEDARNHMILSKLVRQGQGWSIPSSVDAALSALDRETGKTAGSASLKESLAKCRDFWVQMLGKGNDLHTQSLGSETIKRKLQGKLIMGHAERSFCFISAVGGQSYFCLKADLPKGIADGANLIFDAVPSFDKKKNKEAWKAVNVRANVVGLNE
jgi:tetratricopeptide (TPR) repeat protein